MAMKFRRHKLLPFGDIVTCTEKEREEEENYVIHYSVRIRGIPISIFKSCLYKTEYPPYFNQIERVCAIVLQ